MTDYINAYNGLPCKILDNDDYPKWPKDKPKKFIITFNRNKFLF